MKVSINLRSVRSVQVHEYAMRFLFGGSITVIAGLAAKAWGPTVAGLLLAFPAILPASLTLLEKHQRRRKRRAGKNGAKRGREAAALDAAGASLGCAGLAVFALIVWLCLPRYPPWLVLISAGLSWLVVSVGMWRAWELR